MITLFTELLFRELLFREIESPHIFFLKTASSNEEKHDQPLEEKEKMDQPTENGEELETPVQDGGNEEDQKEIQKGEKLEDYTLPKMGDEENLLLHMTSLLAGLIGLLYALRRKRW